MVQYRRYLVARVLRRSSTFGFVEEQAARLAACPAAAQYTDDEAEDFFAAAFFLDGVDHKGIAGFMRRAKLAVPAEMAFDEYRLSRHIMHRWREAGLRQAFVEHGPQLSLKAVQRDQRRGNHAVLLHTIDLLGSVPTLARIRQSGMHDLVQTALGLFTPEQLARHRALVQFGKVLLHRCLTEPEPPRKPSRWEQQRLVKRLRLREVQMRAMQRSLHKLRRERKALMTNLREVGRQEQPQLAALAVEHRQIRDQRAEAERRHSAALAAQAARYQAEIAQLQGGLAAARQDYSDARRLRSSWLPPAPGGE